jgi:hypothetical protein
MSAKGSALLLAARTKFREARNQGTLRRIEVPQWGEGAAVYYWPEMSVDEKRQVYRHMRAIPGGGIGLPLDAALSAAVDQVLFRARDEFGDRLFSDEDEAAVLDTDPLVLQHISSEMGYGSKPTLEDAEKN